MVRICPVSGWTVIFSAGLLFSIASCALLANAQQQTAPAPVLTLKEAVTLGLANNRNAKTAALGVDASREQYLVAKSKRFPVMNADVFGGQTLTTIGLTIKKGQFDSYPATGPIPDRDINIHTSQTPTAFVVAQVVQPLLALHKIDLNVKAARLAIDQSTEQSRGTRQSVSAGIHQAYYGVVQAQESIAAVQSDIKQYEELDRITTEYVNEKTALESDSLTVKAKLAQQRYALLQAQDKLQSAEESLNELMGREITTQFSVVPTSELSLTETDLNASRAAALSQQPSIRAAAITVKQADIQQKLAKSQYEPDLNATFRYISPFGIDFLPENIAAVGLEFKWNPFDWGGRKHTVLQKKIALEQSKQQLEETKAQVLLNVDNQFRTLQEARMAISVAKMNQSATHEKLRETTKQYEQKTALLRDVLQQQAAAETADAGYQQAIAAFWTAKANLDKTIGEE